MATLKMGLQMIKLLLIEKAPHNLESEPMSAAL
jgi:hypothetical protein